MVGVPAPAGVPGLPGTRWGAEMNQVDRTEKNHTNGGNPKGAADF